jgi:2-(1,2-epoxy-1,2-dihydrophenyl)acetyl-CoA isomerase
MSDHLERVDVGAVRVLHLNRPEARNALNFALVLDLQSEFAAAKKDNVRCLVITGRGKGFCAGADVKEWSEQAAARDRGENVEDHDWVGEMHKAIIALHDLPAPTIAMINGTAVGAGLDMALACDFRFASSAARFRCSFTTMGYNPDAGGTWLMPRVMGLEAAKRFAFTADIWSAEEAKANGLLTEIHAPDDLEAATMAFAEKLGSGPSVAIRQTKALIDSASTRSLADQLVAEKKAGEICAKSADAKEAMSAVIAKREPVFTGT